MTVRTILGQGPKNSEVFTHSAYSWHIEKCSDQRQPPYETQSNWEKSAENQTDT